MLSSYKIFHEIKLGHTFKTKLKTDEKFDLNRKLENLIISYDIIDNTSDIDSELNYYSLNSINDNDFRVSSDYITKQNNFVYQSSHYKKLPISKLKDEKDTKSFKEDSNDINKFKYNKNISINNISKSNKKWSDSSSSSDDSEKSNNTSIENDPGDIYNPSKLNEPLRNPINQNQNIAPGNILQIENEGNGNFFIFINKLSLL